jgi:2-polyprenyl-3-methyl-5-hydroxy-6-metoxy-1,4-benzoquinol methylase
VRQRLREKAIVDYNAGPPRTNDMWPDHRARTLVTASLIAWLEPYSAIDPAAGDLSILQAAARLRPIPYVVAGDISEANVRSWSYLPQLEFVGDATEVLEKVEDIFDVVVLTEFLEHIEDPDGLLRLARTKAKHLVASSPEMRPGQYDTNPEHLWMFDNDGYYETLIGAGWNAFHKTTMRFPSLMYDFQIWVCRGDHAGSSS